MLARLVCLASRSRDCWGSMICRGNNFILTECGLFGSCGCCLVAAFLFSPGTTLPLSITSRNPQNCDYCAASLLRPVFPSRPASHKVLFSLPALHTYTPLFCFCLAPCLKRGFRPPSRACWTCPTLCLALGCFLLPSLLHQSWAVLHHLSPTVTAKATAFLSSHLIVPLSSSSAAEQNTECKDPGRSQLNQEGTAEGAMSTSCWQQLESLLP